MKAMALLNNYRNLKASSLVESVVAIAIISICALIAFLVYLNIIKQNNSSSYYKARHQVETLTFESVKHLDYDDDLFQFDGYTIEKKVTINKDDNTVLLSFHVKTANKEHKINKLIPYYEQ